MPEFNFFKPFIPTKKPRNYKKLFLFVLILVFIIPIGYYHWDMLLQLNAANEKSKEINAFLTDPSNLKTVEEVVRKQDMVDHYLLIRDQLLNSKAQLNSEFQVAVYLLDLINDQIPNELFLTQMALDNGTLSIEGYCDSFDTIAQYAYNLRVTGMFRDVMIPVVTKEETFTYFTVECSIKWEGMDEAE
ncbi:PilN domain-containing protein [Fusibacter sp. 3D3]|uniref:PilN domain-containing protein n=1 Tax=Fusibacter sp. 3D3 TaxID=1048380 RepID=UPI0008538D1E|nr:PilN domain-containing protein [Fusibacter sp. 3D3]GAU79405.1 type IV pilus biogenesis protein PilN [Fusibacter sp. 3D3]